MLSEPDQPKRCTSHYGYYDALNIEGVLMCRTVKTVLILLLNIETVLTIRSWSGVPVVALKTYLLV